MEKHRRSAASRVDSTGGQRRPGIGKRFCDPLPIRWRDLDSLGHLNYATYLTFLGEGRDAWLSRHLSLGPEDYVVAACSIQYRAEVTLGDSPLLIDISVSNVGSRSVRTAEQLWSVGNELKAEAEVVIVLWDKDARRSRPISAAERDTLLSLQSRD